jgi:hypothetical protein
MSTLRQDDDRGDIRNGKQKPTFLIGLVEEKEWHPHSFIHYFQSSFVLLANYPPVRCFLLPRILLAFFEGILHH